ncbi:peptidyl-prolyl cis-trans isomerase, FKBP-type [Pseudooceanicola batsensis HTCC2597]|uniref:Peptidyl-prolyl cis-trans isomerase n=1 Tax=Pseudooceanicola batsensis (strain ATCC BAA-863 / DSM 15984 / KCTC 12145 / HTCC2597) TaxID=252305 RepID=A3U3Q4_PSEBH|nr:peptidylprolyl isomerase [Pseudooceanicola batsensis]EAQ01256.1 peptidyl-prolyl cis-trans isomerase, FKBP-type [Pseudooceanicola batsensis HTCC2597]
MTQAKPGDTLHLHYTGKLDDGTVFDSSEGSDPLSFELGSGQIIPGLEAGITGMEVGETRTVKVEPEDAYGAHQPERMQAVDRASVPDDIPTDPGTQLQVQTQDGQSLNVTIADVTEDELILDANHPLAGKTLTFDVELVEIA